MVHERGERRQRAAAMMVGEVGRRKTEEAVKHFCLKTGREKSEVLFDDTIWS
jgi:hypothetical protein